jgi:hypothetical protein
MDRGVVRWKAVNEIPERDTASGGFEPINSMRVKSGRAIAGLGAGEKFPAPSASCGCPADSVARVAIPEGHHRPSWLRNSSDAATMDVIACFFLLRKTTQSGGILG